MAQEPQPAKPAPAGADQQARKPALPAAPVPAPAAKAPAPVPAAKPAVPTPAGPELRHLVRVANTDLNGTKTIGFILANIKGVGIPLAHAVCRAAKISITKKAGALSDAELKKIEEIVKDPLKAGLPRWMVNRRFDYETGQDRHLISGDLQFQVDNDIKTMKKIKTYKGVRHMQGAPVRGQRTRSNFRKNKGKVMGVRRSSSAKASSGTT